MSSHPDDSMTSQQPSQSAALLAEVTQEQQTRWSEGDCIAVEDLLLEHPALADDSSAVLDLIYSEVLLREDRGESPSADDYSTRFPTLTDSLERQFQLHRVLQQDGGSTAESLDVRAGSTQPGSTVPPDPTPRFAAIPGFELLDIAGRGGTGVVYRARDQQLDRLVAIKLIAGPEVSDPALREQLLREAEAAARLRHDNIALVHSVGEYQAAPYLVMEYFSGGTLAQRLQQGPLEARAAAELAVQIAAAVQHAHDQGVIHRDLKPGNILLDESGHPHVSDFGLARRIDASQTLHATGDVIGTPAYMAPEQARGERADCRVDVYSLGALLYELLVGRPPFQAATPWEILRQVMTDDPLPPRSLNSAVPRELDTICQHCLQKDPDRRYASVSEVAAELNRFLNGEPLRARPIGRLQRGWKWCLRNPAVASMSALSLLLLLAIGMGSTIYAFQLAEANEAIRQEQQRAVLAEQQAKTDRTAAIDALYTLAKSVFDDLSADAASIKERQTVVDAVLSGLENLTQIEGDREADRTAMIARQRIADLLALSGKHAEAAENYRLAINDADALLQSAPDDLIANSDFVRAHSILALHFQKIGQPADAVVHESTARNQVDMMLERWPDEPSVRRYLVNQHQRRLDSMWMSSPPAETLAYGLQALDDVATLLTMSDNREEDLALASSISQRIGRAAIDLYDPDLAAQHFADAMAYEAAIVEEFGDNEFHRKSRAYTERAAAAAQVMQGDAEAAVKLTENALDHFRNLAAGDPDDVARRRDLLDGLRQHAASLTAAAHHNEAEKALTEAIVIGNALLIDAPGTVAWATALADCHMKLADVCLRTGRWADADEQIRLALQNIDLANDPAARMMAELIHEPVRLLNDTRDSQPTADAQVLALCVLGLLDAQDSVSDTLSSKTVAQTRQVAGTAVVSFDELDSRLQQHTPGSPVVGMLIPVIRARILGLRARNLAQSDNPDDRARVPVVLHRCLTILEAIHRQQPPLIPQLVAPEPDLIWVRSTADYQSLVTSPGDTGATSASSL